MSRGTPLAPSRDAAAVAVVAGLVALAVAAWFVRPVQAFMVGSDTASSVLYFARIVHGEVLERFLGTTPKPLLTVVYGAVHGLTGDWRAVGWLAIVVYAAAVAATTLLVGRTAGAAAGAFVGAGLIANWWLTQDVLLAYAVSWALLSLATAGLALMVRPRRWLLAGACLAVGALARQEVLLVTAGAAIGAAAWWIAARRGGAAVERGVILVVLVGLLAVPIGAAHDWLLARDPLYSLQVPLIGAEGRALRGLEGSASFLFGHLREQLAVLLLAAVGVVSLVRNRSWTMLLGVVVLGPGMALFFLAVAARGLVTLDRYLGPMDVAILVAAAIGLSSLGRAVAQRAAQGRTAPGGRPALAASTVAAIAAALLLAPTVGPLDDDLSARARLQRATAADWRDLLPSVRAAVAGVPELRSGPATRDPRSRQLDRPSVLVSAGLLPIASVDLDLRLHRLARLEAFVNVPEDLEGRDGSLLYHVPGISITGDRLRWLEIDRPERLAGVDLEPLAAGSDRAWLIRVSAAQ